MVCSPMQSCSTLLPVPAVIHVAMLTLKPSLDVVCVSSLHGCMQQCVVGREGTLLYCHEQAVMGVCSSSVTKFGDVKLHIGGA